MLRYSLAKQAKQAGRKKGTTARLPDIQPRISSEIDYQKAMRSMLRALAKEVRENIIPAYRDDLKRKRAEAKITIDVDMAWFARMQALAVSLTRTSTDMVERILSIEAERHTAQFASAVKRSIGIDIKSIITQEDLGDLLQVANGRNASLIKSLADDTVKKVEQAVYQNSLQGNSVKTLRKQLVHEFGVSESRAKLIARDQMSKLNSDLTQARQTQAGVSMYEWLDSSDERVRHSHAEMDGKICKWDDPTVYRADDGSWKKRSSIGGVELHPGQDINCRCNAIGVVEI